MYVRVEKTTTLGTMCPLPEIPGNSDWNVNGKRFFFGSSHWKIPGTNGSSEKVVLFSWLGCPQWKFVYHLEVYLFHTSFSPLGFWPSVIYPITERDATI